MVQWIARLTSNQGDVGSSPAQGIKNSFFRTSVYINTGLTRTKTSRSGFIHKSQPHYQFRNRSFCIDFMYWPIFLTFDTVVTSQEAYSMLNRFDVSVAREEVERVDTLRYSFEKLLGQAVGIEHGAFLPSYENLRELFTSLTDQEN